MERIRKPGRGALYWPLLIVCLGLVALIGIEFALVLIRAAS